MTYHQLTQEERYLIAAQRMCGHSPAQMARVLGRHRSTVVRELRRNATHHDGDYRAEKAHSYAVARRRRCRRGARFSAADMARVARLIRRKWSAEQISGTLKKNGALRISHETIYRRIRWDKKVGRRFVAAHADHEQVRPQALPQPRFTGRAARQARASPSGRLKSTHRQRIGHWEGDTVMGSDMRHCVLTLVERKTGFAIIKKLRARNTDEVTRAATRAIRRHCRNFKTLTLDNGTEFHNYAVLEQRFPVKVYFATPYHSWERGSNENFNGLLRQYLPKGTCMSAVTQAQCDHIADDLNNRPRKRFGFNTPASLYHRN